MRLGVLIVVSCLLLPSLTVVLAYVGRGALQRARAAGLTLSDRTSEALDDDL